MEIPGVWGEAKAKVPSVGGMEYFLELRFANKCNFFQFFRKRQLLFLNENKITFKHKFTTIDRKKNW